MKIFYDTNIILEFLLKRKEGDKVRDILHWSHENHVEKFLSSGSFYTLTYLIEKYLKNQGIQDTQNRSHHADIPPASLFSRAKAGEDCFGLSGTYRYPILIASIKFKTFI